MKTDSYYDIACEFCGRHMSTDFNTGMARSSKEARNWAKSIGWKAIKSKNICPICQTNSNQK